MIANAKKTRRRPRQKRPPQTAEVLTLKSAAEVLDMHPTTFRPLAHVLAAHYGLTIHQLCGQRIARRDLLACIDRLTRRGLAVAVDHRRREIRVGDDVFPLTPGTRTRRQRGGESE